MRCFLVFLCIFLGRISLRSLVCPPVSTGAFSSSPFVIQLFGSARSCPECSGAENPETVHRAKRRPSGTDLLSCSLAL